MGFWWAATRNYTTWFWPLQFSAAMTELPHNFARTLVCMSSEELGSLASLLLQVTYFNKTFALFWDLCSNCNNKEIILYFLGIYRLRCSRGVNITCSPSYSLLCDCIGSFSPAQLSSVQVLLSTCLSVADAKSLCCLGNDPLAPVAVDLRVGVSQTATV